MRVALVAGPTGSAVAVLAGLLLGATGGAPAPEGASAEARGVVEVSTAAAGRLQDPEPALAAASAPVRLEVPALGISTELVGLAVGTDGRLEAPERFETAGWYSEGVVPGSVGPAIVAGHVDSATGPAVFARLSELQPGDLVSVATDTGEELRFEVYAATTTGKAVFPTSDVYGATTAPELRLITCDGTFDEATGHYSDNLVVFARLAPDAQTG